MTAHFENVTRESPRASKVLVALFSSLIAFVVLALGWQQWLYTEHRKEMVENRKEVLGITAKQDILIENITKRQDWLRERQDYITRENSQQDAKIAQDYVTLTRYACDMKEMKEAMKEGFNNVSRQLEALHQVKR